MKEPWISVGVVADINPSDMWAELASAALMPGLSSRVGSDRVVLVTCRVPATLAVGAGTWHRLDELAAAAPDVVVACGSSAMVAAERHAPSATLVTMPELDRSSGLAALVPVHLDPVAVDVRRRMLRHLGVLPDDGYVLDDALIEAASSQLPLRPIDVHVLAATATEVECADPAIRELRGDASTGRASELLDGWADAVMAAVPERRDERLGGLTAEVRRLRQERDAERERHAIELAEVLAAGSDARRADVTES